MDHNASNNSVDQMSRNSDDECQSSDEQETHYGINDYEAVHISKKKEALSEPCGPSPNIQTHSQCNPDSSYKVVCTVSMVLAVPRGYEDDSVIAAETDRHLKTQVKSKCIIEAPKAQAYYHIEYNLLPDNREPIKVDLVMFGSMAKVYMDKNTKVLKPWQEGEHLWLSWSQTVKLNVTRELLIKMSSHKITFKLWDTKDRVSSKAKYDRPKAFRRIVEETEQKGGIKGMVYKLRALYENQNPTKSSKNSQKDIKTTDYQQPSELECNTAPTKSETLKEDSLMVSKEKHSHKTVQERTAWDDIHKNGAASAELRAAHFLAGEISLTDCLMIRCKSALKGLCSIMLDQPLMSEELKTELNPLIITISSASSLPSTPVAFSELEQKCMPVYCQYKFHNMPVYRTKGLSHDSNIYFNDVNVILTGLHSTEELLEFLRGPPLEIEIHDRDRKAQELSSIPAIFGTEATDDKLASTALVSVKKTSYSPFKEIKKACDSFGIAKLNLSDLLQGHRCLKLSLPIIAWNPGTVGTQRNRWGEPESEPIGALDGQDNAMPNGHYLKANSKLKVQVEIAYPFSPETDRSKGQCPFGRIICIFKYNNAAFLEQLRSEILRINTVAFQLHSYNEETSPQKLHGLLMDATERENKHLNALTGFHFLDEALHLFVLEGLRDEAIKKLWETVNIILMKDTKKQVMVLYNSGLSFSKRIYNTLDVGFSPVHLHKPLETIMRQPIVYIKDTVPYTCLQAMLSISHLCQSSKLEEVVQNNLFPSAEMIHSLRNEFGIIPSRMETLMPDSSKAKVVLHPSATQRKTYTQIDNCNKKYLAWKQSQANQEICIKNIMQANIKNIRTATRNVQIPKPTVIVAKLDDGQASHNYSIQTMNSTSLAKKILLEVMAKNPDRRFTYSQHYQSFTMDPVDVEAGHKASDTRSQAAWQTCDGFILYNKDSIESNTYPKHPGKARVEELEKEKLRAETLCCTCCSVCQMKKLKKILPDKESARCYRVPDFKCHMQKTGLDKLHDILKDKPKKLSLKAWTGKLVQLHKHNIYTCT
ncbi:hypothetical protein Baya_1099 [Bagarius yarrelli]|uniref:DUF4550 domain-containing protein n=1 Tax=Bagarius yarrelli TaxID=175774 RepID=A0A556TK49_BAGYA|nr:hypothetical protein Baya_1099 [Bagarius yarrelli]